MHRLGIAAVAEHLVQRQNGVVGRMVGVVAGRAVGDFAVLVANREEVSDRDRLVVGHEEAILRAGVGHQERTRVLAPGCSR